MSAAFPLLQPFRAPSDLRVDICETGRFSFHSSSNCPPPRPSHWRDLQRYLSAKWRQIDYELDFTTPPFRAISITPHRIRLDELLYIGPLTLNSTRVTRSRTAIPASGAVAYSVSGRRAASGVQREAFDQWSQEVRWYHPPRTGMAGGRVYSDTKMRNNGLPVSLRNHSRSSSPRFPLRPRVGSAHRPRGQHYQVSSGAARQPGRRLKVNLGCVMAVEKDAFRSLIYGTADATNPLPENFVPGSQEASNTLNAILGSSNTNFVTPSRKDDKLMPSVGLQFEASPDLTAYASYTKGFKAGGYSGGSTGGDFGPKLSKL